MNAYEKKNVVETVRGIILDTSGESRFKALLELCTLFESRDQYEAVDYTRRLIHILRFEKEAEEF